MPVSKYRSVADMPRPELVFGAGLASQIRALWRRSFLLSPPAFPRGVARFRSIAEANEARTKATLERVRSRQRAAP
jgi:hypothetical protein